MKSEFSLVKKKKQLKKKKKHAINKTVNWQ